MIVFASHLVVDRWSAADVWLGMIRGRALGVFLEHGHEDLSPSLEGQDMFSLSRNHWVLRGGFACLVYAAVDNTFHIILMLLGGRCLGLWE